jgi:hypothetical protein
MVSVRVEVCPVWIEAGETASRELASEASRKVIALEQVEVAVFPAESVLVILKLQIPLVPEKL